MSARGENPFEAHRIHARAVSGVGWLEHNKRRHRIHGQLESSVEKTRQVRIRSGSIHSELRRSTRSYPWCRPEPNVRRPSTPGVHGRPPRGDPGRQRSGATLEKQRENQKYCFDTRKLHARPNGSCHKCGEGRKGTIRETGRRTTRLRLQPSPPSTASTCPVINCGAAAKNITAAAMSAAVPFRASASASPFSS
jgi:hypothetical protein